MNATISRRLQGVKLIDFTKTPQFKINRSKVLFATKLSYRQQQVEIGRKNQ